MFQSSLNNYIYIFQNKYTILYLSTFQKFYLHKTFLSIDKNHTHLSSLTFSSLKHPYKKIYRFALNENEFAIRKKKTNYIIFQWHRSAVLDANINSAFTLRAMPAAPPISDAPMAIPTKIIATQDWFTTRRVTIASGPINCCPTATRRK